jgi:hypothetical protein
VRYSHTCGGYNFKAIISAGSAPQITEHTDSKVIEITGSSPLSVTDSDPALNSRRRLVGSCEFTVRSIETFPSSNQTNIWKAEKDNVSSELANYIRARDGFTELSQYKSAFVFLNKAITSLIQDVGLTQEVRQQLNIDSELSAALDRIIFETVVFKKPDDTFETFDPQEKKVIDRLVSAIALMPKDAQCENQGDSDCSQVKLSQYISNVDQALLDKISRITTSVDDAKASETHFASLAKSKEEKLISLCTFARNSGADLGC